MPDRSAYVGSDLERINVARGLPVSGDLDLLTDLYMDGRIELVQLSLNDRDAVTQRVLVLRERRRQAEHECLRNRLRDDSLKAGLQFKVQRDVNKWASLFRGGAT